MRKPLIRIPYTDLLSASGTIPAAAKTLPGAVAALQSFLTSPPPSSLPDKKTVLLTGAGLSVSSGLADYRGVNGTYRVNKTYRPIYYHEFVSNHEARKRYWARSFLGWTTLHKASPNHGHHAVRHLAELGLIKSVITQNVDSFHPLAHPAVPTLELHGYLRSTVCTACRTELPRDSFQNELARLNPAWADFLAEVTASGALDTEDPERRRAKGLRANPDGDVDLPGAPYTTFRYPACPTCLARPPICETGQRHVVRVDADGAWHPESSAGILKPAVVMFGESIPNGVKAAAENAIDEAGRLLILATSLATYSAWRLAKRAKDRGMPIALVNIGGARGEDQIFTDLAPSQRGEAGVRVEMSTDELLPALVKHLQLKPEGKDAAKTISQSPSKQYEAFKDMLS